jgi:hypothetical protein
MVEELQRKVMQHEIMKPVTQYLISNDKDFEKEVADLVSQNLKEGLSEEYLKQKYPKMTEVALAKLRKEQTKSTHLNNTKQVISSGRSI